MMIDVKFQAAEYASKINKCINDVISVYDNYHLEEARNSLLTVLNSIKESDKIKVVFIGQYTAGKSSIIS
ncbi:MAG TPA: hypothetical protein PK304_03670, partial [Mobilitalea sp.]|nr:hypothetical protein [Mobilitalea sp.]